jgi:FtsZ-interacting cell division protein ZipA
MTKITDKKITDKSGSAHSDAAHETDELREQVEQTREELGETVAQLAAKADLKKQAQDKLTAAGTEIQVTAAHAVQVVREHTPQPVQDAAAKVVAPGRRKPAAVIAAVVATVAAVTTTVLRRRKTHNGRR